MKFTRFCLVSVALLLSIATTSFSCLRPNNDINSSIYSFEDLHEPYQLTDSLLIQRIKSESIPSQILVRKAYVSSYNKDTKCPNYVAWHLTAEHANGSIKRPKNAFRGDKEVPEPRVEWYDYKNTGMSRGHLCPAGDNKWDITAMYETFLMTNIVPQDKALNDGYWNEIEMKCRLWAKKYGDIYIVSGPVPCKKPWKTIGEKKIFVPDDLFKVVLCLNGSPKVICFIYHNSDNNKPMNQSVCSLKEIEQLTGIEFFPTLPKSVKQSIENEVNLSAWGL